MNMTTKKHEKKEEKEEINIYIITLDEPFYINPVIRKIVEQMHGQIVGISIVPDIRLNQSLFNYYGKIFRMFGFLGFCNIALRATILKSREIFGIDNSLHTLIKKYNLRYIQTKSVNSPLFVSQLKKLNIDIILSFCGQIYKKEALSVPRFGVINKHCSLLPHYQGVYPVFWALLNSEKETGVTLHLMDEHVDKGPILKQKRISILPADTFHSLYVKCHELVPDMVFEIIQNIKKHRALIYGKLNLPVFDKKKARFFSYPAKKDISRFKLLKKRFF